MKFEILTIFPDFFRGPLDYGIVRRAREAELIEIGIRDLRAFTRDRHRTVDDRPFGGGEGMVLKPEPLFECVESLGVPPRSQRGRETVVLLSPQGRLFCQELAQELAALDRVVLICGRYEGVDERVAEHLADREISVGDYVLTGGELAAAVIVDAVTRLVPGALGNEASARQESFTSFNVGARYTGTSPEQVTSVPGKAAVENLPGQVPPDSTCASGGLLDYPHYTRPAEFRGMSVPEALVSGNHDQIRRWRRRKALEKTFRNRPELLQQVALTDEERDWIAGLQGGPK
jgi:tRNA (guanine37-N1)-methyltransferase